MVYSLYVCVRVLNYLCDSVCECEYMYIYISECKLMCMYTYLLVQRCCTVELKHVSL